MPVTLKRFLAPLCVFCLGMWVPSSFGSLVLGAVRVRPCSGAAVSASARLLVLLGGVGLLEVGGVLVRCEDHDHVAAVLLGRGLDEAELLDVLAEALQQPEAQLGTRLLAPAEHDRDLDLVAGLEEPDDVALLRLVVVRVDLRPELHLLDDGEHLVLAALTGLLGRLVLELAVVHELADRRPRHRRDLDEVEVAVLGELEGLVDRHDADLLAGGTDQPDLGDADPVVDAGLSADGASWSGRAVSGPDTTKGPARSRRAHSSRSAVVGGDGDDTAGAGALRVDRTRRAVVRAVGWEVGPPLVRPPARPPPGRWARRRPGRSARVAG